MTSSPSSVFSGVLTLLMVIALCYLLYKSIITTTNNDKMTGTSMSSTSTGTTSTSSSTSTVSSSNTPTHNVVVLTPSASKRDAALVNAAIAQVITNGGGGGIVYLGAGTFHLEASIWISSSNVELRGVGNATRLVLNDLVNEPVISIGPRDETPSTSISYVKVSDLSIDGNSSQQASENATSQAWIRNNGIDVRSATHVSIVDCHISNVRSGCIVISYGSDEFRCRGCTLDTPYYDCFALYASSNGIIDGFICSDTVHGAGFSIDNQVQSFVISNGVVFNTHDVGVFMRSSSAVVFNNILIHDTSSHGVFCGDNTANTVVSVPYCGFINCSIYNASGWGIFWGTTQQGSTNRIINCQMYNNSSGNLQLNSQALTLSGNQLL